MSQRVILTFPQLLLLLLSASVVLTDATHVDCSLVECPAFPECPVDSQLTASSDEVEHIDEEDYEEADLATNNPFSGLHFVQLSAVEPSTEQPPAESEHKSTTAEHAELRQRRRRQLPAGFSSDWHAAEESAEATQLHKHCCSQYQCVCKDCAPVPRCAAEEMRVLAANGKGVPGNCCASYKCVPKRQCGEAQAEKEYWRDACVKCICIGSEELCLNHCQNEEPKRTQQQSEHADEVLEEDEEDEQWQKSCYSEYMEQPKLHGEQWFEDDYCSECSCSNGRRDCISNMCAALECKRTVKLPGKCCPVCAEELSNEHELSTSTSVEQNVTLVASTEQTLKEPTTIKDESEAANSTLTAVSHERDESEVYNSTLTAVSEPSIVSESTTLDAATSVLRLANSSNSEHASSSSSMVTDAIASSSSAVSMDDSTTDSSTEHSDLLSTASTNVTDKSSSAAAIDSTETASPSSAEASSSTETTDDFSSSTSESTSDSSSSLYSTDSTTYSTLAATSDSTAEKSTVDNNSTLFEETSTQSTIEIATSTHSTSPVYGDIDGSSSTLTTATNQSVLSSARSWPPYFYTTSSPYADNSASSSTSSSSSSSTSASTNSPTSSSPLKPSSISTTDDSSPLSPAAPAAIATPYMVAPATSTSAPAPLAPQPTSYRQNEAAYSSEPSFMSLSRQSVIILVVAIVAIALVVTVLVTMNLIRCTPCSANKKKNLYLSVPKMDSSSETCSETSLSQFSTNSHLPV